MRLSTAVFSASMLAMAGAEYFNEIKVRWLPLMENSAGLERNIRLTAVCVTMTEVAIVSIDDCSPCQLRHVHLPITL